MDHEMVCLARPGWTKQGMVEYMSLSLSPFSRVEFPALWMEDSTFFLIYTQTAQVVSGADKSKAELRTSPTNKPSLQYTDGT